MTVHGATVEEVIDDEGDMAFRATCLETGVVCDAWGFPGLVGVVPDGEIEGAAIARALSYLGDATLHVAGSLHYCPGVHVMEHDRAATKAGRRAGR